MGHCLVLGYRGSGKNTWLTRQALKTSFKIVKSNFHFFNFKKFSFLKSYELFELPENSMIIIDEAYKWLDCRLSQRRVNIYLSQILQESRKPNQDWYISTQYDSYIDFRFRDDAELIIECENIHLGWYPNGMEKNDYIFNYKWQNKRYKNKKVKLSCENAEYYYQFFDTTERVEDFGIAKFKLSILQNTPKLLYKEVKRATNYINEYVPPTFTKAELTMCLLEHDYDKDYANYVYPELKRLRNPNWHKQKKKK